jgi:hypothetical protein
MTAASRNREASFAELLIDLTATRYGGTPIVFISSISACRREEREREREREREVSERKNVNDEIHL